jgi:hypothetical protein
MSYRKRAITPPRNPTGPFFGGKAATDLAMVTVSSNEAVSRIPFSADVGVLQNEKRD